MNIKKVILTVCAIIIGAGMTVSAAGFEYGDNSGLPGLNQFAGEEYVIYQNADNGRIELAVIYADDINDRSIMIERKEQADIINEYLIHYGGESSLDIAPIERPKLYLTGTDIAPYISKWYLSGNDWIHTEDVTGEAICDNTDDLIFSNIPVIEVIKKKMKNAPYPRNYNGVSFSEFDSDSNGKYLLFSEDGLNYNIRVKTPEEDDNKYCLARKSYYGNGRILMIGVNEFENLPEFKRMKGYSNDIIYILNSEYEIIDKVFLNTLRECAGFYNGYFYFYDKDYYENYKYNEYYYKSEDGINLISITKDEYDTAIEQIDRQNSLNSHGYIQESEYNGDIKNPVFEYYLRNENGKYKIVYENSTTNVGSYSWSNSKQWCRIFSVINKNEDKIRFVTFDGIYRNIRLPEGLQTQNSYVIWATEDYVFIDADRETYYRIPIEDTFKQNVIVRLDDKILGFDQPPVTENDRTLAPIRFLFEQMGAAVTWDDATQTATATVPVTTEEEIQTFGLAEEKSVTFSVDNTTATVNGSAATMDVPARLINDKTMVPLRFLSENLGFNVQWDEASRTAIVTTE